MNVSRRDFGILSAQTLAALVFSRGASGAKDREGLDSIAKRNGLRFGTAVKYAALDDERFVDLMLQQCGIICPANEFKWHVMNRNQLTDYTKTDRVVSFAKENGLICRGHTLFWDKDKFTPSWVKKIDNFRPQASVFEKIIETRISQVCGRYRGRVSSWDVVNEAVQLNGAIVRGPLFRNIGESWIDTAFRIAHKFDPMATLVYNDYPRPSTKNHQDGVLRLLTRLKSLGSPVNALGVQAHLDIKDLNADYRGWKAFLRGVEDLGLQIVITELDVIVPDSLESDKDRDATAGLIVQQYLGETLEVLGVKQIVCRSLSDKYEGLSNIKPRPDGKKRRPSPYDAQLQPKIMCDAIRESILSAPQRGPQPV